MLSEKMRGKSCVLNIALVIVFVVIPWSISTLTIVMISFWFIELFFGMAKI